MEQLEIIQNRKLTFVLANTHKAHELVDGKYADLKSMCYQACDVFKAEFPKSEITHLRDVTVKEFEELFEKNPDAMSEDVWKRAKHIVYENDRVLKGKEVLRSEDMVEFGKIMSASHASSRFDFGNSCQELDDMIDFAAECPGFLGGRLMGGGFGGCTINLVEEGKEQDFGDALAAKYKAKYSTITPTIMIVKAGDGAFSSTM